MQMDYVFEDTEIVHWNDRPDDVTSEQLQHWNSFEMAVTQHENGHHETAKTVAETFNQSASSGDIVSGRFCTKEEAEADLQEVAQSLIDEQVKIISKADNAAQEIYHGVVGEYVEW